MSDRPVLLGVFAHPDDESFGPGATLARYVAEGVDVHIVIATDGVAGSVDSEDRLTGHDNLAQVREKELDQAVAILGATLHRLPHRDSGMQGSPDNDHPNALIQQPVAGLTQEVTALIRRLRPQVILTHDQFGGYGHPDHIMCCTVTTAAFAAAGDPAYILPGEEGNLAPFQPQKLYYTTFGKGFLKWTVRILRLVHKDPTKFGRNQDINLAEIATWDTPVHARIRVADYLAIKERASEAHASQYSGGPSFMRAIPGFLRKRIMGWESFTRVFPAPGREIESDLFAGVLLK